MKNITKKEFRFQMCLFWFLTAVIGIVFWTTVVLIIVS